MSSKKAAPTDEELLAELEELGGDVEQPAKKPTKYASSRPLRPNTSDPKTEADPLAELDNLVQERPQSRPHTPRLSSKPAAQASPKRAITSDTVPSAIPVRTSEEKASAPSRKSGESARSFHQSFTPATSSENDPEPEKKAVPAPSGGGGWWGTLTATASAAVKQAESLAREIQKNEEAQRWAEQVKGNVGALRGLGDELRSRALPTFTTLLHTLAPPISSHERLTIHITHDLRHYPSLDPLIHQTFARVMAQVEGGDLLVLQRGHEASPRRNSSSDGPSSSTVAGWSDGPWWRQPSAEKRSIGAVTGVLEGSKLAKAAAESYATEHFATRGGVEQAARQATENLSESNPVRSSDIFLAIQAVSYVAGKGMFGDRTESGSGVGAGDHEGVVDPVDDAEALVCFAIYLDDPIHGITFATTSQSLPQKWIDWLDDSGPGAADAGDPSAANVPDEIAEIVNGGGVDPREWVAEWVEECLALGVGVVAQRYVARRMGVGEGGLGRGKGRLAQEGLLEGGAGEAARAL